jgi:uncharacterized protein YndB with AHSA1/START domain
MPTAERTVVVERPPQEVFAYLADATNDTEWRPGVVDVKPTSSSGEIGATYRMLLHGPRGRHLLSYYQITDYDPPRRLAFEVTDGPARPTGVYDLAEPRPGRTRLRYTLQLKPRGLMRLVTPAIWAVIRHDVRELDNLKTILEQR